MNRSVFAMALFRPDLGREIRILQVRTAAAG